MSRLTSGASYDVFPYMNQPYAQTHPDRLATVGTLLGLKPARADRCRVLELGCADGGNLIPMAVELPESQFVGVENSDRQATKGRQAIAACGLKNIEVRTASILDVDDSYGQFDYIISHGVYSWIPEKVRDKMRGIYRRQLAPEGIGYISYNTLPGWHMRGMIRDMMRYHVGRFSKETPQFLVGQARALLDFLAKSVQGDKNPYGLLLRQELEALGKKSDAYLFHEQLEPHNDAFYFSQVSRHLTAHGLHYLGETYINNMGAFAFPSDVREILSKVAPDQIEMERYLDFLRNRTFRQSLVCHEQHRPAYTLNHEHVALFHVAAALKPKSAKPDLGPAVAEAFVAPDGAQLETKEPIVKAALLSLAEKYPQTIAFEELCRHAGERVNSRSAADLAVAEQDAVVLTKILLHAYASTHKVVEFWQCPPRFVIKVSARPSASLLARWQAPRQQMVTNLRHEFHQPSELTRKLLPLLDGTRDREALLGALVEFLGRGEIKIEVHGRQITDAAKAHQVLQEPLEQELQRIARSALLVA